jgi:glutathione synthase
MLKKGQVIKASATLQELGIYSSLFIDVSGPSLIREHKTFGKLVRTKNSDTDEGGVATGYSVVDQPFLTKEIGPLSATTRVKPLIRNL